MRRVQLGNTARWNLLGVAVVLALIAALWPRSSPTQAPPAADAPVTAGQGELVAAAADADLPPCPDVGAAPSAGPLAGLRLPCPAGGALVDMAAVLAGKPAVVNLWTWWCPPCAKELPVLQEFAQRAGQALTVLTVHSDPNALKGLQALRDYGVHLPSVQDSQQRVAAVTGAPAAYPATVLVHADGTVAHVLTVAFPNATEIAEAVDQWLGVAV